MTRNTDAEQIERLNSRVAELLRERDALGPQMPAKLTGELACILECCDPPEKQTDEAVERLIFDYQPMWDRLRAALGAKP